MTKFTRMPNPVRHDEIFQNDRSYLALSPAVGVFKSHNVILAQVAARLHFYDFERYRARVREPVSFAERYIRGLVFREQDGFFPTGHFSGIHPVATLH